MPGSLMCYLRMDYSHQNVKMSKRVSFEHFRYYKYSRFLHCDKGSALQAYISRDERQLFHEYLKSATTSFSS
jgi:hypothetical protein